MSNWKNDARWIIGDRKHEVFIEDDHFLVVEDEAFDYDGSYVCRPVTENTIGDACGASSEYLSTLDKAGIRDGIAALSLYIHHQVGFLLYMANDRDGADLLANMLDEALEQPLANGLRLYHIMDLSAFGGDLVCEANSPIDAMRRTFDGCEITDEIEADRLGYPLTNSCTECIVRSDGGIVYKARKHTNFYSVR